MGIEFTKAYVANGKTYATLEDAQKAEIESLFGGNPEASSAADIIMKNAERIIDVLTTNNRSRPKARGVKKPRKPKTNGTPPPSYTEANRQDSLTPV